MAQFFNWFSSSVRSVGASFPVAASLVQAHAEIDAKRMEKDVEHIKERIERIEDPISNLHEDVQKVSREFFDKMIELDSEYIRFDERFYAENSRVLAILESKGFIKGAHDLSGLYHEGLILSDPSYVLYLCNLFADTGSMEKLYEMGVAFQ